MSGFRTDDLSGYRTLVKDPSPGREQGDTGDPEKGVGKYPVSVLPHPPWGRKFPKGPHNFNMPGPSGTSPDGRSIHKDKARTPGVPGSPPPRNPSRSTPDRRPSVTASGFPEYYKPSPRITLQEIIRNWREGDKEVDAAYQPLMFPTKDVWGIREYTWTRENARSGRVNVGGKSVFLQGSEKWDALTRDMQTRGWVKSDPAIVHLGQKGGVKVGEGNHRLAIAKAIGIPMVPVRFLFYDGTVSKRPQNPEILEIPKNPVKEILVPKRTKPLTPEEEERVDGLMDLLFGPGRRSAAMEGPHFPGRNRQRKQRGQAKRYFERYYRKNRTNIRTRMKKWYKKVKNLSRYKRDQQRREKDPQKFERKPGGYSSNAERAKDYRETKKAEALLKPVEFFHLPLKGWGRILGISQMSGQVTFQVETMYLSRPLDVFLDEVVIDEDDQDYFFSYLDQLFGSEEENDPEIPDFDVGADLEERLALGKIASPQRQRRQRGREKIRSQMYSRKNRVKNRLNARKRYKKLRKNPQFKRQQKIRRKHPERFKRRSAEVLTAPEIAFVIGSDLDLGYVHKVSPMSGLVTYYRHTPGGNYSWLESLPVQTFLDSVGFLTEQDADSFFDLVDVELGLEAYKDTQELPDSEDINQFVYDGFQVDRWNGQSEMWDQFQLDPTDDDYYFGVVNLSDDYQMAKQSEMLYEKRPPEYPKENEYNRADDRIDRKKKRRPGEMGLPQPTVEQNPGSAKVIPDGHDFVNKDVKKFAAKIPEILRGSSSVLQSRAEVLRPNLKRVDARNAVWLFDVPAASRKKPYRVRLKALPGETRDLQGVNILVSCSCPFWQWQGPEHWGQSEGYLYGKPEGTASVPSIRDPEHEHGVCKHALSVLMHVTKNKWEVPIRK